MEATHQLMPAQHTVNIGESELSYLFYDGPGPTIVLLHATGFSPWLWHPVARSLSARYRIVAPYFCDHRMADPENGGLSWLQLAKDLVDFLTVVGIESPYVVGHSMGGAVPIIAAGKLDLAVSKMVLIEPIILPKKLYAVEMHVEEHPLASKSIKRLNYWEDRRTARQYLTEKSLFQSWDPEVLDLYLDYGMTPGQSGGLELTCHPRREAALFMGSMAFNPWPVIGRIDCPVLVLEGEQTENKGLIDFKKISETFQNGRYHVVSGAGHLIPMEKPSEVTDIVASFLGEQPEG